MSARCGVQYGDNDNDGVACNLREHHMGPHKVGSYVWWHAPMPSTVFDYEPRILVLEEAMEFLDAAIRCVELAKGAETLCADLKSTLNALRMERNEMLGGFRDEQR